MNNSAGVAFNDLGKTLSDTASNVVETVSDSLGDTINNWGETLSGTASNVVETVSDWGYLDPNFACNVADQVVDVAGNIKETVNNTPQLKTMSQVLVSLLNMSSSVKGSISSSSRTMMQPIPQQQLFTRIVSHLSSSVPNATKTKITNTTIDIAKAAGYHCEEHLVQTGDGYILTMHRIPPYTRTKCDDANARIAQKGVVFLQHGLVGCSSQWVTCEDDSLGYLLSNAGYDVWMGNFRGNIYSRLHASLTTDDKNYWKFSWDEMAKYDLPAMLDYVLKETQIRKIWYVGHSMGTTTMFALLSSQPVYQDHITAMIALAPVATVKTIQSPVKHLAPLMKQLVEFLRPLGYDEDLLTSSRLRSLWEPSPIVNLPGDHKVAVSNLPGIQTVAENIAAIFTGLDANRVHKDMLPTILSQNPAGTSTQTLYHFGLNVKSGEFNMFDYGEKENLRRYNQRQPPTYDVGKIKTPVYLFYSKKDWLTGEWDIEQLQQKLGNLQDSHEVEHPCFSHLDFLWATDAKALVYDYVLNIINNNRI